MTSTARPLGVLGGALVGALTLLGAATAQAEPADASHDLTIFGFTVSGRLSVQVAPDYLGAKTYSVGPTGSLSFHRPGAPSSFHAPDDSPSLQLFGDKAFSAGLVVRGRSGRKSDGVLTGVHKVHFAFEPGVYAEWWPTDALRLHAEARRGVAGNQAWSGDLAADLVHDDGTWLFSVGPRLHLGDAKFTRTYFDLTAADAAASPRGLPPYAASGGFVSAGALAGAEYRWSPRWSVLGDVRYDRLMGDAADSPIVARVGSPDQFRASVGVRYRFGG